MALICCRADGIWPRCHCDLLCLSELCRGLGSTGSSSGLCQPVQREENSEILSWVGTELPQELSISFCCSTGDRDSAAVESKRGWVPLGVEELCCTPKKLGKSTQRAQTKGKKLPAWRCGRVKVDKESPGQPQVHPGRSLKVEWGERNLPPFRSWRCFPGRDS